MSTGMSRSTIGGLYELWLEAIRAVLIWTTSIIKGSTAIDKEVFGDSEWTLQLKFFPSKAASLSSQQVDFFIAILLWQGACSTSSAHGVAFSIKEKLLTWPPQKCMLTIKLLDETSTKKARSMEDMDLNNFIDQTNVTKICIRSCSTTFYKRSALYPAFARPSMLVQIECDVDDFSTANFEFKSETNSILQNRILVRGVLRLFHSPNYILAER